VGLLPRTAQVLLKARANCAISKEEETQGEKEKAKAPTPEIQIFDYATAPNILDDLPVEEEDALQTIRDARKGRGESKRGKKKGAP
jgi:hypothetical protein